MRRDIRPEIIGCLRVSGSWEEDLRSLRSVAARDWEGCFDWLHLSGIALAFWNRLQQSGAEDAVPRPVGAALAACLADHIRRIVAMREEFDSLNRRFESAGIEYAAWKGLSLIPEYCPEACLRPSYDYDYLISGEAWEDAQKLLQTAGYACKPDPGTRARLTFAPRLAPPGLSCSPRGLYAENLPRKVELHLSPWDGEALRIRMRVPERPLDRRIRRSWKGSTFYSLGPQDTFVFQVLHAFQHILHDWCRLGWLLDIAYFLENRSTDSSFWQELNASLDDHEPLTEAVALVLSLAARLFQAALPAPIKDQVLRAMEGRLALWVEHYGIRSALGNFSQNKYALFLYREFVRNETDWQEIRRKKLLPLHKPNRLAGSASPASPGFLPGIGAQAEYIMRRLVHHLVTGAGYSWESARWNHWRRLSADRVPR